MQVIKDERIRSRGVCRTIFEIRNEKEFERLVLEIDNSISIEFDKGNLKELLPHLIQWQCTGSLELPEIGKENNDEKTE